MTDRIAKISEALAPAHVFADIGCDHGYCTQYGLRRGLFDRAYISDISAGSLAKAERLLAPFIAAGKCIPVVADGMHGLPERCDSVLIAGLGGEEIIRILEEGYLPERFVLQPMKNTDKVRRYLLGRGAKILTDVTFGEGKYYDLIVGENAGGDDYSTWEIAFGRDNLRAPSPSFLGKLKEERAKLLNYLSRPRMGKRSREELLARLGELEVVFYAIAEDL